MYRDMSLLNQKSLEKCESDLSLKNDVPILTQLSIKSP